MLRIMKINVSFCYMKDVFFSQTPFRTFSHKSRDLGTVYRLGNHTCTFMITISGHTVPLDNRKLPVDRIGNHTVHSWSRYLGILYPYTYCTLLILYPTHTVPYIYCTPTHTVPYTYCTPTHTVPLYTTENYCTAILYTVRI